MFMFVVFGFCSVFFGCVTIESSKRFFQQPENRIIYGVLVLLFGFCTLVWGNMAITSL